MDNLDTQGILLRCKTKNLELQISLGKEIVKRLRNFSEAMKTTTEKIKQLKILMDKGLERC